MAFPSCAKYHGFVFLGFSKSTVVEIFAGLGLIRSDEPSRGADRGAPRVRDVAEREVTVFGNSFQITNEMRGIGVAPQ
ncbi:hypothetical protein D3C79_961610 [compost metagenome]